jgi:hypothetical protein
MPDSLPITERRSPGSFLYFSVGSIDGGPELYLFTCWGPDHEDGPTQSVYAPDLASKLAGLQAGGWINRTDRGEYWDRAAKCWLQGSGARRTAPNAVRPDCRPTGLPILSTEPLTHAERDVVRQAVRALRLVAERLDEALAVGRVDCALEATQFGVTVGESLQRLSAQLGSNR